MNHDITHCNGDSCPVRETCHRYNAYLDLQKPTNFNEVFREHVPYHSASECINNGLNMYLEENHKDCIRYGEAIYIV